MMVNPQCRHLPEKSGRGPVGKRQEVVKLDFSLSTDSKESVVGFNFVLTEPN